MDKASVFQALANQETAVLLDLLNRAYEQMNDAQRQAVFGPHAGAGYGLAVDDEPERYEVDGKRLFEAAEEFKTESLAGVYWAPFNVNSKNYMQVPAETRAWFERLAEMLEDACLLTEQGDHAYAVACFDRLFALIDELDRGTEIVFAEERGSWMLRADRKQCLAAYMTSLAATTTPEEFTQTALPFIRHKSQISFFAGAYEAAARVGTRTQMALLDAELQRLQ